MRWWEEMASSRRAILSLSSTEGTAMSHKLVNAGFHLPYNPDLVARAREMRKNPSPAEKKLWYGYLRNFKHRVLRQRPIDHFIVDF